MDERQLLKAICEAIEEKKGERIVVLDVSKISSFTDFFVLCQGTNQRQNQAICDSIRERLKKSDGLSPSHIEGYQEAEWILLDYLQCVVHVFSPEARDFYKLERLWSDGARLSVTDLAAGEVGAAESANS